MPGPTAVCNYNNKTAYIFRKEVWRNPENSLNRKYLETVILKDLNEQITSEDKEEVKKRFLISEFKNYVLPQTKEKKN